MCNSYSFHLQQDAENKTVELSVILLSNVSRDPKGARKVAQAGDALQGYYVRRLFELFVDNDKKQSSADTFSWVASILSNVTQVPPRMYCLNF